MIIYFSATGNSKYVANKIATEIKDTAVSLTDISSIILNKNEPLGIVFPVYYWGLPSIVEEFFSKVNITLNGNNYVYMVLTYGGTLGQADWFLRKILNKKGIKVNASFGVITVDNYTISFNVNNKEEIKNLLDEEEIKTNQIILKIKDRKCEFIKSKRIAKWLCKMAKKYYNKDRKTKNFNVLDNCIGCGLCEKSCPVKAIEIIENKPTWVKESCALCLKCLHACPKFSIQYKDKTNNNGQYQHP